MKKVILGAAPLLVDYWCLISGIAKESILWIII